MKKNRPSIQSTLIGLLLPILLAGCTTLDYRSVQSEFDVAAQADNGRYSNAFVEQSPLTVATYDSVADKLSNAYIGELDEALHPNAWLLRSFSEWRTGKTGESRQSAQKGLEAGPESGSRDDVMLRMMKALNNDSEIHRDWLAAGETFSRQQYFEDANSVENRFGEVIEGLKDAKARLSSSTPESTNYYYHYQQWRVLQNWTTVISSLADEDQSDALTNAKTQLGQTLSTAIQEARESVPPNHWLRQRMN